MVPCVGGRNRDPQAERVQHPRGEEADRDGHHHEDQRQPVDILQANVEILGGLARDWCKGQPHLWGKHIEV